MDVLIVPAMRTASTFEHSPVACDDVPGSSWAARAALRAAAQIMFRRVHGFAQPFRSDLDPCRITSADGSILEAAISTATAPARGAVILCHPFTRHGCHYFVRAGIVDLFASMGFHALLFNMKGFGKSEMRGASYADDVVGAIMAARRSLFPATPVYLAGYSFGGYHAVHALPRVDGCVNKAFFDSVPVEAETYFHSGLPALGVRLLNRTRWAEACGTAPITSSIPRIARTPLYFAYGSADPHASESQRVALQSALGQQRLIEFAGMGHLEAVRNSRTEYRSRLEEVFA